ncbi:MAG: SMI1/KNR4 family protein [Myxococcales bacterium]|nr:SMI1/KNR4 family protein [Myxococcales bacterium]MBK7195174.1 SMI1/KNR4 family protein [Myxococcales bacterium]MBP6843862.1 SMI1/KNR4 family protein [Kofleriaceae bacterium]
MTCDLTAMDRDDALDALAPTLGAWLTATAAADPRRRRFGAARHGYQLGAPLPGPTLDAFEAAIGVALPAAYRGFVTTVGDGGAGPYYGLWPLAHPLQRAIAAGEFAPEAPGRAAYRGVIGLGHVGCGQIALLIVRGPHAGEVWIDARGADGALRPIARDFGAYYVAWVQAVTHDRLLPGAARAGACPLPRGLSHYLASCERRAQVAPGALSGAQLREALAALGPGSIRCEASGDDPFFAAGAAIDPCPPCAVMIDQLHGQGLGAEAVVAGENWPP